MDNTQCKPKLDHIEVLIKQKQQISMGIDNGNMMKDQNKILKKIVCKQKPVVKKVKKEAAPIQKDESESEEMDFEGLDKKEIKRLKDIKKKKAQIRADKLKKAKKEAAMPEIIIDPIDIEFQLEKLDDLGEDHQLLPSTKGIFTNQYQMYIKYQYSVGMWCISEHAKEAATIRDMCPFSVSPKIPNKYYKQPDGFNPVLLNIVRLYSTKRQTRLGDLRVLERELLSVQKGKSEEERQ